MRWRLFTVGKPKLAYAAAGVDEYLGRLRPMAGVTWTVLRAGSREEESEALLAKSSGLFRIVLDERGREFGSRDFAARIREWEIRGVSEIALLIGGADGHTQALRDHADLVLRLSAFTLQHELALVVLLEQIYRAHTILRGTPYHRD